MDFSLSLDAKEVLFHLNYMGYRNVTAIQLKDFMKDLKKLMKYEITPKDEQLQIRDKPTTSRKESAAPTSSKHSVKLFEHHTVSSKIKERKIDKSKIPSRPNSAPVTEPKKPEKHTRICNEILEKNKENLPVKNPGQKDGKDGKARKLEKGPADPNPATKMWIRSKSAQTSRKPQVKKTDPVALYQAYQKDWERFRAQICESSHSDLRWLIRERMLGNLE